jgi:excisionase family DNA binding protein
MSALAEIANPDLLDVEEAAHFLHVKTCTIGSWILHNRVTYLKLGRRVFLRKSDLENLISSSVVPARARQEKANV